MSTTKKTAITFKELHNSAVQAYESELKQIQATISSSQKKEEKKDKQSKKIIEELSPGLLNEEQEEKELGTFIKKVRPKLANRKTKGYKFAKEFSALSELAAAKTAIIPSIIGGTILAPNVKPQTLRFAGPSNTITYSLDTTPIKVFSKSTGRGLGWQAIGYLPTYADFYYQFTPTTTAMWNLNALLAFDGFYIIKADDGYFTSKSASVNLSVSIKVHQYSWQGETNYNLLYERVSNNNIYKFIGVTPDIRTSVLLRATDTATVHIRIALTALARGSGSYAEINFNEGTGNRIIPVFLLANPVAV
jgi:hypothetical protein